MCHTNKKNPRALTHTTGINANTHSHRCVYSIFRYQAKWLPTVQELDLWMFAGTKEWKCCNSLWWSFTLQNFSRTCQEPTGNTWKVEVPAWESHWVYSWGFPLLWANTNISANGFYHKINWLNHFFLNFVWWKFSVRTLRLNCCKPPYLFCSYTPSANQQSCQPSCAVVQKLYGRIHFRTSCAQVCDNYWDFTFKLTAWKTPISQWVFVRAKQPERQSLSFFHGGDLLQFRTSWTCCAFTFWMEAAQLSTTFHI